jgi:UDP-glucose 4-epimerase
MSRRPALRGQGVLVTGGAGFIGSHLVDRLLAGGAREVVVVDNLFTGTEANLEAALGTGRATLYRDDAEDVGTIEYILERHAIGTVFNCATKALNYSFVNPSSAFSTNVTVALNLLEAQRRGRFQSLCHFSTSEVYGSAVYEPMDEAHPRNPTTTYAAGKAAADLAVESYVRMFDLDAYIVRPFNNYGPRQNHRGMLAGVIPITAWRILHGLAPELHGDGTQSREFVYVLDTVDAILRLHPMMAPGETVDISTDGQLSIKVLLERICEELGYAGEITRKPGRKSDVACHVSDGARLRGMIDFVPTPFESGLRKTLDWYRAKAGPAP